MKRLSGILFSIGFIGLILSTLLRLVHINPHDVFFIANIFFFAAIILYLIAPKNNFRKYTNVQRIFTDFLWAGILLILTGQFLQYFSWGGYRNFLIVGFGMLIIYALYVVIAIIADKLRINPKGIPTSVETSIALGFTRGELEKYEGIYSNVELPLKIAITSDGTSLIAKATGQSAFYLDAIDKNTFRYEKGRIVIEFHLEKNELTLKQHGGYFPFIKEP